MKKIFASFALIGIAAFASAQTITFDKTVWDYGTVAKGSDGHRFFTVTNTGDKPLIVNRVQASCGCTTPEWSQDPILPGKSAKIKVGYNTQLVDPNGFLKTIEVYSNDEKNSRAVIQIKGAVVEDAPKVAVAADKAKATTPAKTAKKVVKKG